MPDAEWADNLPTPMMDYGGLRPEKQLIAAHGKTQQSKHTLGMWANQRHRYMTHDAAD
jgi:hypothetical protein